MDTKTVVVGDTVDIKIPTKEFKPGKYQVEIRLTHPGGRVDMQFAIIKVIEPIKDSNV